MADFKSLDSTFSQAVERRRCPGVVAGATDKGTLYEGAFGRARSASRPR